MAKVGGDLLNKFSLSGGQGLGKGNLGGVNELIQSQNNMNLGALKANEMSGGIGTFRSNFGGVDKSMDNLKLGFAKNFGSKLGLGQDKGFEELSSVNST